MSDDHDHDPIAGGTPDDAELAEEERDRPRSKRAEMPEDEKAEEELEPLEGGAETMADLDEEGGQANRPGTERPPA